MAKAVPFFDSTASALKAVTALYDFIWPTAVALWNLRWQVAGYHGVRGASTVGELRARFVEGSGIHGANLHLSCLDTTWERQQENLAQVVLVNLFAIYEQWAQEMSRLCCAPGNKQREMEKHLQFPTSADRKRGIAVALKALEVPADSAMTSDVLPILSAGTTVHIGHVEDLLTVYRYFKECRNALMHGGGSATQAAEDTYHALAALPKTLPFRVPQHHPVRVAAPVTVSLHGVVGFSDIIRRTMLTIDAASSGSKLAARVLVDRWRTKYGAVQLKTDPVKRDHGLRKLLVGLGLPPLRAVAGLASWFIAEGLLL